MTVKTKIVTSLIAGFGLTALSAGVWSADLPQILDKDRQGTTASVSAANEVEKLQAKTDDFQAERQSMDRENRMLEHYRNKLAAQLVRIEEATANLEKEREELRNVRIHIYPLMEDMHAAIKAFIKADKPFLKAERTARLANLENLMVDPALTDSQKMDALLDAYQVEVSYGYTVGAESGTLDNGELVDFLRVGRLGWFAINEAKGTAYTWNTDKNTWEELGGDWAKTLAAGVKVAAGVTPPDVMLIPAIPVSETPLNSANTEKEGRHE